jgi:hypothetical protein
MQGWARERKVMRASFGRGLALGTTRLVTFGGHGVSVTRNRTPNGHGACTTYYSLLKANKEIKTFPTMLEAMTALNEKHEKE